VEEIYFKTAVGHAEIIIIPTTDGNSKYMFLSLKSSLDKHSWVDKMLNDRIKELENLYYESQKLSEEYRENCDKLRVFFKAFTDKTVVIDKDYNIINSNSEEIAISGKCYRTLFGSESKCQDCPTEVTFRESTTSLAEKEDSGIYYRLRTYPIINSDGKVESVLEVVRNISNEKRMEFHLLESEKFASLGKLVAGVAHEINNPNTFILGNIKIIKEALNDILPITDAEYKRNPGLTIARLGYDIFSENISVLVDDIYNGAEKIKKIVDELRKYARKDDGTLPDIVGINPVIEYTVRLIKKQIGSNVKISLDLGKGLPEFAGNISRLEQVIINLVTNAAHAIGNRDGEIKISTRYNAEKSFVVISVSDNGRGMDEETKRNVFDPFFTTKRSEGGIGLGLSISYRIIKEHKGEILVESQVGSGTTFTVLLPAGNK
jgi:signal transduction histidine kinase